KNTFSNPQDKVKQLLDILSLVDEAESILSDKNVSLNEFGKLLDLTWKLKKGTGTKVTLSSIDDIYNKALQAGVIGGKLLGAGGGGFLLFYVEKDKQEYVKKALSELMAVPFNFEDEGASIVYYKPIVYIPRKEIILK
ncbi:GHMP kinase family protein, partial [Bacteroides fragilis str. 3988T(B)14]